MQMKREEYIMVPSSGGFGNLFLPIASAPEEYPEGACCPFPGPPVMLITDEDIERIFSMPIYPGKFIQIADDPAEVIYTEPA